MESREGVIESDLLNLKRASPLLALFACTRRPVSRGRSRRICVSAMQHSASTRSVARATCATHSVLQKPTLHAVWLAVLGL